MLNDLPEEILIEIFSFFSPMEIIKIEPVNKRTLKIANDARLWKQLSSTTGFTPFMVNEPSKSKWVVLAKAQKLLFQICLEQHIYECLHKTTMLTVDATPDATLKEEYAKYTALSNFHALKTVVNNGNLYEIIAKFMQQLDLCFKHLFALTPGRLTQRGIDFLTKVSVYANQTLSSVDIAKFDEFFDYNLDIKNEEYSDFARVTLGILGNLCSIENDVFFDLILKEHPDLPKIKFTPKDGASLLHIATYHGQTDKAIKLVERGADVNLTIVFKAGWDTRRLTYFTSQSKYSSPLYLCLKALNIEDSEKIHKISQLIEFLLMQHAKPLHCCMDNETYLWTSPYNLCEEIIENSDKNHPNYTALEKACAKIFFNVAPEIISQAITQTGGRIKKKVTETKETFSKCLQM